MTEILHASGVAGECVHEMLSRELYELQCDLAEQPDHGEARQRIERTVAEFRCVAASGNGYAGVLPIFARLHPGVRLIHLKRRDKAAFIASQIRTAELYPETYVYYTTDIGKMRRIAAFHTGESTVAEWRALSLPEKISWFYDYTHRHVEQAYALFPATLRIYTEDLSKPETLRALTEFMAGDGGAIPAPRRLNGHALIDIYDFPPEQRAFAQWIFGRLDAARVAESSQYLVDHVLNATVAWLGYLQRGVAAEYNPRYGRPVEQVRAQAEQFLARLTFYQGEMRRFLTEMDPATPEEDGP
jgi:hypothetical protein